MSTRSKEQSPSERAAPAHAGLPHFKNPNTNWPFLYSVRDGFVLVNMAPRETTKQRLNKMEEAKW